MKKIFFLLGFCCSVLFIHAQDADSKTTSISSYQSYDFVPGDKVLFEDLFTDDRDGEFPARWELTKGQAVVNKLEGTPAFFLTEGNFVRVGPRMKTHAYLSEPFTIEFDYYIKEGYGISIFLIETEGTEGIVTYSEDGSVSTNYFPNDLSGSFPGSPESLPGKWHHGAIILKDQQMKCYLDQYRVLVMPSAGIHPKYVEFGGIGSPEAPIIFNNVRIASGGEMNMIGKKFTESKIITHGINFDVNKASIKPESMGTINMIVKIMKDNPDIRFEIEGHTDNSGDPTHNLVLSQQRADAVKAQLISSGIPASRLSSKGFGDIKPISDNNTPEGKANNRRVEFVKM
ncbi:MAG: OmpA family protein [Chitinophagaceae bacterium]